MEAKAKKICLVTPEYPPRQWGGLARTARKAALHLASLGQDVQVVHFHVSSGPPPLLDENRSSRRRDGILVHDVALGREAPLPGAASLWDCPHTMTLVTMFQSLEILQVLDKFNGFVSFFVYPVGYVVGLCARKAGVPHVACIVGNDVNKYAFSPEKAALVRSGLENADHIVALSRDLVDLAQAITPVRDRASVIYNSVELPPPAPPKQSDGPFRIGCAGIFKYAKGLPYLLKAVGRLRERRDITLDLAGAMRPEEEPVFEAMLDRCGVRDLVRRRGVVPHAAMAEWLQGLDLFALPSVSEGCPNVLMEAMAAGLACVAARVGAVEDLIENEVSGLLASAGDARSLARAIMRLMDRPDLRERLGRGARQAMEAFSPARERAGWAEVLRRTAGL